MAAKISIETILSHSGLCTDLKTGAISTPIYQTATFGHPQLGKTTGYDYSRTSNPTRDVLEKTLAELEGGAGASTFASGMAAITACLSLFKPGEKIIASDDLYGGTYRFLEKLASPWGIKTIYADFNDVESLKKVIEKDVSAFFIETPTNPLMKITDLAKVIKIAHSHNIKAIVDNTFMTPYCQRPIEFGADIVIHSGTKFLAGHNDTLFGAIISREKETAERIAYIQNATGAVLSPFDSWLAIRGIKTLGIRLDRAQENALKIAKWLVKRENVKKVFYPGLSSHDGYKIHSRQSTGSGAVISFKVKNKTLVRRIINNVKVITYAESLGGVESLITYPISQTHADIPPLQRKKIGITDDLIRLSVGIENVNDLINDLNQAIG